MVLKVTDIPNRSNPQVIDHKQDKKTEIETRVDSFRYRIVDGVMVSIEPGPLEAFHNSVYYYNEDKINDDEELDMPPLEEFSKEDSKESTEDMIYNLSWLFFDAQK